MIAQAVTQALIPRFAEWGHLPFAQRNSHLRRALGAVERVMLRGLRHGRAHRAVAFCRSCSVRDWLQRFRWRNG